MVRKSISTKAGSIAYLEAGTGRDVILIHGALVTADDMALSLFDELSLHFHVVAFDRPGHGGSDQSASEYGSPWSQAAILHEASRILGMRKPAVFGHSFGGAVALSMAMLFPDKISGVLAAAPICFPEPRLEQMLFGPRAIPLLGGYLARTGGVVLDAAVLPILRHAMFLPQSMPTLYEKAFPFAWASRPEQMVADGQDSAVLWPALTRSALSYSTCRSRVTIVGGTHDVVVNNGAHGRVAANLIPRARFRWSVGSGHMLHHFQQDLIVEEIERLLSEDLPSDGVATPSTISPSSGP